ncbi:TPA: glycosyl transferase family 28 [Escherichia coli]|nr:glycosyl transferase family 28 [Escherichia coli]
MKLVFYSHDTMGLGHFRRNLLLADAVQKKFSDTEVLLINSARESGLFTLPSRSDILTLPAYAKTLSGKYHPRSLGNNIRKLVSLRRQIIRAALREFCPDVMVVDNVPGGALSELLPVLPELAGENVHLVLGLRDIIDEPSVVRRQWHDADNYTIVSHYYSDIWIYGDRSFYDLSLDLAPEPSVYRKISFLGYPDVPLSSPVLQDEQIQALISRPFVLCLTGGGQDGYRLASVFAETALPPGMDGVILTGSQMPQEEVTSLQRIASMRHDLHIIRFVSDPLFLLQYAHSVVAMGGYNTLREILSLRKRALIVPRIVPRLEQWIRASRMAEKDLIKCLHPDRLTPRSVTDWLISDWYPSDPRLYLSLNGLHSFTEKMNAIFTARRKCQ